MPIRLSRYLFCCTSILFRDNILQPTHIKLWLAVDVAGCIVSTTYEVLLLLGYTFGFRLF